MTLEEATRALREDGAMGATRKRALRDRVLATPRKRSLRAVRWAMPIAAVLAAASVWASVARDRHHASAPVTPPPVVTTTTTVAAPIIPVAPIATTSAPIPVATSKPIAPPPDDSERRALRAYREAERLQFEDKDYAHALDAWDRYIPLAGKSPLLVDAKWQRALCLVRLGRTDEAREALAPFARGDLGAYRRDEAQTISNGLR